MATLPINGKVGKESEKTMWVMVRRRKRDEILMFFPLNYFVAMSIKKKNNYLYHSHYIDNFIIVIKRKVYCFNPTKLYHFGLDLLLSEKKKLMIQIQ